MNNPCPTAVRSACWRLRVLTFLWLAFCHPAIAEPAWKKELTPPDPGSFPPVPPCVLDFQVSWNGLLNAGKLRMECAPRDAQKPGVYIVRSCASSTGPAAVLFPFKSNFWSELNPSSFKPRIFNAVETDDKKTTTTITRHFPDRVECDETSKALGTGIETHKERIFKFSPVFDIFSAMLFVRSHKLDDGDTFALVVQPFGAPYLIRVKVRQHEVHLQRNTIRLSVGIRKIDRNSLELLTYKKMKTEATLWLSDDAERIPVEMRAAIFIGDIRATLTAYQKVVTPP